MRLELTIKRITIRNAQLGSRRRFMATLTRELESRLREQLANREVSPVEGSPAATQVLRHASLDRVRVRNGGRFGPQLAHALANRLASAIGTGAIGLGAIGASAQRGHGDATHAGGRQAPSTSKPVTDGRR